MSALEAPIQTIASRIKEHSETMQTEEAAKTSIILPFLQALGYDVFNPSEVIPEYTADVPGKKDEKVDYAIRHSGNIVILIECKGLSTQLNERHLGQLFRYFTVSNARLAILTNGREYQFYADLDESNRMDRRPFFIFDILDYSAANLIDLAKFTKDDFEIDAILEQAERLKYSLAIKRTLEDWFSDPPDALIKILAAEIYDGRLTSQIRDVLSSAVRSAFQAMMRDRLRNKLSSALEEADVSASQIHPQASDDGIVTTHDEIKGHLMIKVLLNGVVAPERIVMRDAKSYCAILLDDNNRKPIARLHFNRTQKYVGLFDGEKEERIPIGSTDDLMGFKERFALTAHKYDNPPGAIEPSEEKDNMEETR